MLCPEVYWDELGGQDGNVNGTCCNAPEFQLYVPESPDFMPAAKTMQKCTEMLALTRHGRDVLRPETPIQSCRAMDAAWRGLVHGRALQVQNPKSDGFRGQVHMPRGGGGFRGEGVCWGVHGVGSVGGPYRGHKLSRS